MIDNYYKHKKNKTIFNKVTIVYIPGMKTGQKRVYSLQKIILTTEDFLAMEADSYTSLITSLNGRQNGCQNVNIHKMRG